MLRIVRAVLAESPVHSRQTWSLFTVLSVYYAPTPPPETKNADTRVSAPLRSGAQSGGHGAVVTIEHDRIG